MSNPILKLLLLLLLALLPALAAASGWERLDTIHFNGGELDFGTVPRRGSVWYDHTDRPLQTEIENGENARAVYELDYDRDQARDKKQVQFFDRLLKAAIAQEDAGRWAAARQAYERMAAQLGWTGEIRDHVEVLTRYEQLARSKQKSLGPHLRRYLHAMALLEGGYTDAAEQAFRALSKTPAAGFLQEHALYQVACAVHDRRQYAAAIPLYQKLLSLYPHGVKTEAALIMLARASILPAQGTKEVQIGMAAVRRLLHSFPHTRFQSKAIGLAGRYHLFFGNAHQAAWCYLQVGDLESAERVRKSMSDAEAGPTRAALFIGNLRRLGEAKVYLRYSNAIYALDRLTKLLTAADTSLISSRVVRDPEVGAAYLYYRIYHCRNKTEELTQLAQLADKIVVRSGGHKLAPFVRVRLAEAFYQAKQYRKALAWVERGANPAASDRGLFVRGATLHKMGRDRAALASFNALLQRFPESPLRHGAREELALLYEAVGDMGSALKQYFLLGYQTDAAFFLDVRMPIPEPEAYYHKRADFRDRIWDASTDWGYNEEAGKKVLRYTEGELVAYSLGIRYLRKEKWEEAQAWMRRVPRAAYIAFSKGRSEWEEKASPDPLRAIRELGRLQRAIALAGSKTARAAATYRYASYYYTHGTLLLYNSAAWLAERRDSLADSWNKNHFTNADESATRRHMYEHEVYARTLSLCKEIAARYPHTPTAPQALYRAACCADYLAGFNEWWRTGHNWHGQGKQGDQFSSEAVRLMNLLVHRYPKHPLVPSAQKYAQVFANQGGGGP